MSLYSTLLFSNDQSPANTTERPTDLRNEQEVHPYCEKKTSDCRWVLSELDIPISSLFPVLHHHQLQINTETISTQYKEQMFSTNSISVT